MRMASSMGFILSPSITFTSSIPKASKFLFNSCASVYNSCCSGFLSACSDNNTVRLFAGSDSGAGASSITSDLPTFDALTGESLLLLLHLIYYSSYLTSFFPSC